MIELTAAQVAAATGGRLHADPDVTVTGTVIVDSRQAGPGALFVALPGERVDGHDFAATAVESGAALVLAARELDGLPTVVVDDPRAALGELARYVLAKVRGGADGGTPGVPKVVAVTGSVGKTTTKDLLGQLLAPEAGEGENAIIVPKGSFNNEIGLPLTVLRVTAATRYLVLEMGADRVGNIAYLTRIAPPDVGVVLAVGVAHVGYFGSVEAIAKTKAEMVSGVVDGGSVVLNADDLRVAAMAGQVAPGTTLQTFGTIPTADVRAEDISVDGAGRASFTLRVARLGGADGAGEQRADVALQLVGPHHVSNALAAATVALRLGVSVPDVAERLSAATARSPHRMAVTERPDGVTVIDDAYNANPDSMKAGLRTLAVMAGRTRRSVAVLGEMRELGDGARAAHDEIGRLVVRLNIKQLVVVGDGAYHIHEGAMQEGSWGSESIFVPDLDAARTLLDESLEPGDVVLVKSSHDSGLWELGDHLSMVKTTEDNNK